MLVSRRHFFFGSFALRAAFADKKAPPERPNVLLILIDELPAWILGSYGNKEIYTPNLDRFARTGTRFTNHIVATPAPQPSRATILTGRAPMQLERPGAVPLEKVLGGLGYVCRSGAAGDAAGFLDQQSSAKPFFLTVAYTSLQPPYEGVAQKYVDLYALNQFDSYLADPLAPNARKGKEMLADRIGSLRKVAAALSAVDDSVSTLLAKLYQRQLRDNTLVILTGTCGALYGRHGLWDSGDASDPVNMFDEVVRTPLIWSWFGRVPPEGMQVAVVSSYDLVPTVCDFLSADLPAPDLCGRSYQVFARGMRLPKKERWRDNVFAHYQNTDMAREDRYKVILRSGGANELYDLVADPLEQTNQYGNDQFASLRTTLSGALAAWKQKYAG